MDKIPQGRFRSKYLWSAIIAQVSQLILLFSGQDFGPTINVAWTSVSTILVLIGVLNDPTSKNTW
jgi:uncharacterized membrane protein